MHRLLIFSLTLVLLLVHGQLAGQDVSKKGKKKYEKVLKLIHENERKNALIQLEKLIVEFPLFLDAHLTKANTHLDLNEWENAIHSYQNVLSIDSNYHDQRIWYTLSYAYKNLKDYKNAIKNLELFIDKLPQDSKMNGQANKEIEQLRFVAFAYNNPVPFNPVKLDSTINSQNLEYLPAFNADGSVMVFTRRVGEDEDLYIANIENDSVVSVEAIETINSTGNEGAHIISPDGNLLIFTACDRNRDINNGCDLFISTKKHGMWTRGQRMSTKFNTRFWESQPSISSDGKSIFFSSDRPGGLGKKDIWFVTVNQAGKFADAKNLGVKINTKGNESSPFIHPDGKTLYFRSDYHPGLGDYDLFVSKKDSTGLWSEPVNLGYPINTEKSEGALFVSLDGRFAYFSSDRGNEPPQLDIFKFELPANVQPSPTTYLKAVVYDKDTQNPLEAHLEISSSNTGDQQIHKTDSKTGIVLSALPSGDQYFINISSKGYLFYSKHIDLDSIFNASKPYILEVGLEKIPVTITETSESKPVVLENIFFESGSSNLLESSLIELTKLKTLLDSYPLASIRIIGHTDDIGSEIDNQMLSEKRALGVKEYLVTLGIGASRIEYIGMGEVNPIADNDTAFGKSKNRRTEFVLLYK